MPVLGKTKREVVSDFRCAEILAAARRVFAEKGFEGATVDDIARAAGLAKGTVYLYYRSKRDIYWAALKHGFRDLHEETKRRVEAAETIEAKIRAFIATKAAYFEENRDFFKIYYSEFGHVLIHPAQVHRNFKDFYLAQSRVIESVLQEAVQAKVIRELRTGAAAFAILDITRGLITQRLLGWSRETIDEDVRFVFDLLWKGIANR